MKIISKIDASLSQGNFITGKKAIFLYLMFVVALSFPLLSVIVLFFPSDLDYTIIFALIGGNIMFLALFTVLVYICIKNSRLKQKIIVWLEDAIEIKAYSKKIGENRLGFQPKATKIQIVFKFADQTYVRDSAGKVFGGWQGYLGTYTKYADREIRILYSPKYDEILILRD